MIQSTPPRRDPAVCLFGQSASADRWLIVTADDLGLHEDINRGIQIAYSQGIVTSASLVACGRAFDHAVEIIAECPDLDVGVHLTLVEEEPLCRASDVSSVVGRNGRFLPSHRSFTIRALAGRLRAEELWREFDAQIQRVLARGLKPSHLNSHQHVHLLPPVWKVTKELSRRYGIPWIRVPYFDRPWRNREKFWSPFLRLGLNGLSVWTRYLSSTARTASRTVGLSLGGHLSERGFADVVSRLCPGINELVVHPGLTTEDLQRRYRWGYDWSGELAVLTASATRRVLRDSRVYLTQYSKISFAS